MQRAVSSEICAASMQDAMIVFLKVDTDSGEMTERDPPMVPSCGLASISGVCFASVMPTSLGQAFLRISSIILVCQERVKDREDQGEHGNEKWLE